MWGAGRPSPRWMTPQKLLTEILAFRVLEKIALKSSSVREVSNVSDEPHTPPKAPAVPEWAQKLPAQAWRAVKAMGPLMLSLSSELSKKYADHKFRIDSGKALTEAMGSELRSMAEAKAELTRRYLDADAVGKIEIEANLKYLDEKTRTMDVYVESFKHMKEDVGSGSSTPGEIEPSWVDRFNDLARKHNEPWRRDLLAKALAQEAETSGSIGTRALWFIGTIEESTFNAFASLLDLCTDIGGTLLVPGPIEFIDIIPGGPANRTIGHLVFLLEDSGLVGNHLTSRNQFAANSLSIAAYGKHLEVLRFNERVDVHGLILAQLGAKMALLYSRKANALGEKYYKNWLANLPSTVVKLKKQADQSSKAEPTVAKEPQGEDKPNH